MKKLFMAMLNRILSFRKKESVEEKNIEISEAKASKVKEHIEEVNKIDKNISDMKIICSTVTEISERFDKKINELENQNKKMSKLIIQLTEIIEDGFEEYSETVETKENITNDKIKSLELKILENKKSYRDLDKKFNAILNILADKKETNTEVELPNLFVGDISLRELWRKQKGNKDLLLYTIAFLMKKTAEEKGNRLK
jgi:predicted RNase H-like nuclease (RuvC/YqgF family)